MNLVIPKDRKMNAAGVEVRLLAGQLAASIETQWKREQVDFPVPEHDFDLRDLLIELDYDSNITPGLAERLWGELKSLTPNGFMWELSDDGWTGTLSFVGNR